MASYCEGYFVLPPGSLLDPIAEFARLRVAADPEAGTLNVGDGSIRIKIATGASFAPSPADLDCMIVFDPEDEQTLPALQYSIVATDGDLASCNQGADLLASVLGLPMDLHLGSRLKLSQWTVADPGYTAAEPVTRDLDAEVSVLEEEASARRRRRPAPGEAAVQRESAQQPAASEVAPAASEVWDPWKDKWSWIGLGSEVCEAASTEGARAACYQGRARRVTEDLKRTGRNLLVASVAGVVLYYGFRLLKR